MSFVSRGFKGRPRSGADPWRVPPGQYVTSDYPVLSAGPTPHTPIDRWDFQIVGEVDTPRRWTWDEFRALPSEEITRDIHCVTKWTKLDTIWRGVSVDTLLDGIDTSAEYVIQFADGGYTTNLLLDRQTTSPASGRRTATTTTATHGESSDIGATELAGRRRRLARYGDDARQDDRLRCP